MSCRIGSDKNGNKHCIPRNSGSVTKFNKNGINLLKKNSGKMAKIVGEKSGADKGAVKNIKYGNKFYYMYTDVFHGPKVRNGEINSKNLHKYVSDEENNLSIVVREISFLKKAQKTSFVPKVFLSELFEKNNSIKLILATEDLSKMGFRNVGHYLDTRKMKNISFLKIKVQNKKEPVLEKYLKSIGKDTKYAAFYHPKYYEKNLEKWYKYNKKFLDHLFKGLHAIHKLNIYHHDLHAGNVWYNGKKVMFIDFGRASTLKESFEFRKNEQIFMKDEKRKFSKEKNIHRRRMLAELSKNKTNPSGRHEMMRHDIDDKIMVEYFYRETKYYILVHKFKLFLAKKYSIVASKIK